MKYNNITLFYIMVQLGTLQHILHNNYNNIYYIVNIYLAYITTYKLYLKPR